MSNIVEFEQNTRRLGLLRIREEELRSLELKSNAWGTFWQACSAGKRFYSLTRIAAYIGQHRDHHQFCYILSHLAPDWLAHLGWDGGDVIRAILLDMLFIELGAYDLIPEAICAEFRPIISAEHFVSILEEEDTVSEALIAYQAELYLAERWCERRDREENGGL